jgi:hypothetical protein
MKTRLLAVLIVASANLAHASKPETPAQVRRIVAQSLCLAVAYPNSDLARDSEAVYAVYAPLLTIKAPVQAKQKIEQLATAERPASPTPVGNHNLALAKCALFAERPDVLGLLGAGSRKGA